MFPAAKFIFPIRDPYTWLDSFFNQWLVLNDMPTWRRWRKLQRYRYGAPASQPHPGERILPKLGLSPLDSYLKRYRAVFKLVADHVPPERLLMLKTFDISREGRRVGTFLDPSDPVTHNPKRTHVFQTEVKQSVLERLDPEYVNDRVHTLYGPVLAEFFPEVRSIDNAELS